VGICAQDLITENITTVQRTINDNDYYFFLVATCNISSSDTVTMQINYHTYNPGGEELSSGQINLKVLTTVFTSVWAGLASLILLNVAFVGCGWRSRRWRGLQPPRDERDRILAPPGPIRPLHWTLLLIAVCAVAEATTSRSLWYSTSTTGEVNLVNLISLVRPRPHALAGNKHIKRCMVLIRCRFWCQI
jgi:magnesium-transporting ATPase (P-type)